MEAKPAPKPEKPPRPNHPLAFELSHTGPAPKVVKEWTETGFAFREIEAYHFLPFGFEPISGIWKEVVLSFNVWFQEVKMPRRMKAIGDLVVKHNPDLIAFQEVTVPILAELLKQEWAKTYFCSDPYGKELSRYGNVILSKKCFNELILRPFESQQGRKALFGSLIVNGTSQLLFGTFHFESYPTDEPVRGRQMAAYKDLVKTSKRTILVGDTNIFHDFENARMEPQFQDTWKVLYQKTPEEARANPGYTCDTQLNEMSRLYNKYNAQTRIDRLFFTPETLEALEMEIIGTEPFEPKMWPSDHWGIVVKLRLKD